MTDTSKPPQARASARTRRQRRRGPGGGEASIGVGADGIIAEVSDGISKVLGWDHDELVGEPLTRIIPERFLEAHAEGFGRFVHTGELTRADETLHLPAVDPDGTETEIELVLSVPDDGGQIAVVGTMRSARDDACADRALLTALQTALASDAPVPDILERCLQLMGERLGWRRGTMWIVVPWLDRLRPAAFWTAEGDHPAYVNSRRGAQLARGESIPGQVWESGAPVWTTDLADSEIEGAVAGLFFPLLADGHAVGVVELVDTTPHPFTIDAHEAVWLVADELGALLAESMQRDVEEAQRERLHLALSARGMGIWTFRVAEGELQWDEQVERIHGFAPGSFAGTIEAFLALVHEDDQEEFAGQVERAVLEHERFGFCYRIRRPDGTIGWVEGSGVPLLDLDGEVRELTGISFDVTDEIDSRIELEERASYAALAADVGRAFVRQSSLDAMLAATAEAIVDHLDVAFARVWLLDARANVLELRASAGLYTHLDGAHSRVGVGELKIGRIAASLRPHLTNQVVGDPQVSDQEWARREGMVAFAGYPLVVGDRCVGVMALFARRTLPDTTLSALGSVADTVAIGVEQARAADRIRRLLAQEREQSERLAKALTDRARVAEVLQESLLPPSLPDVAGYQVAARYRAGVEEVGGDFYDLLPLPANTWAIIIGDICGRGPEAARLTALARHSLRMAVLLERSPADALDALNRALLRSDNDARFCSALCGLLRDRGESAEIELGIAGHPPAIVLRGDGTVSEVPSTGPLLGLFADARYRGVSVSLEPGDMLVTYTDGVIEARNGPELFGAARLRELLSSVAGASAADVVDAVIDAVQQFDQAETVDDLAILAVKRLGAQPAADPLR